jgi:SSS family solute:Na+ symporter/sodium/pantothenate symporter
MRYLQLIQERPLLWGLFILYMAFTSWLAWLGHKKTTDLKSFAVGGGDMNPWVVGITLAASIASMATFVINPGFVYVHGVSAIMHFGVAANLGATIGLIVLSLGFRRVGKRGGALTLPQWVGSRFESQAMTIFFAAVNLLSLTFVVLIVGGLSIVMQSTLGLTNLEAVLLVIGFTFSYIFVGGTYAHAYTNTLQGIIMTAVAVIVVASGLHLFSDGITPALDKLALLDPNLAKTINPQSTLFGSFFSVFVSGFVIGFAVVAQPHILIKALYVKKDSDVAKYLGVCFLVSLAFTALLLVGLYAQLLELPKAAFQDPATGLFRQDLVMTVYLTKTFGPTMLSFVMVALLAAGMSTLDGLLLALSSIAANDLFLNLTRNNLLRDKSEEDQYKIAHRAGQIILIVMGLITFVIALNPPTSLGIFGQLGVYAIVASSITPILCGILFPRVHKAPVFIAAILALVIHGGLYGWAYSATQNKVDLNALVRGSSTLHYFFDTNALQLGLLNPAVTATYGIIVSLSIGLTAGLLSRRAR